MLQRIVTDMYVTQSSHAVTVIRLLCIMSLCSGQQLAQQMQQSNPELVEQLRSQMRGQSTTTSTSSDTTTTDQSQPGSSICCLTNRFARHMQTFIVCLLLMDRPLGTICLHDGHQTCHRAFSANQTVFRFCSAVFISVTCSEEKCSITVRTNPENVNIFASALLYLHPSKFQNFPGPST